jgi:small subunit ribosomal protein S20
MPHTTSAEKSLRQDAKRRERNREKKKALRTQIKKLNTVLTAGGTEEQQVAEFKLSAKLLDKAASKNVIHKNAASRKKSRLQKRINKLKAAAPVAAKA